MKRLARWILRDEIDHLDGVRAAWVRLADDLGVKFDASQDVLREIASQETPTANATVKRMAKMAREAIL